MNETWSGELAEKHGRTGVLLDANVFVLWIVGSLNPSLIPEHKRTNQYRIEHFRVLQQLIARFSRIVTTPHVLSEVSNLVASVTEPYRTRVLEVLRGVVQAENLYEESPTSKSCSESEIFVRLGLTDAVIVDISKSGALVVTDDNELIAALESHGSTACSIQRLTVVPK